MSFLPDNQSPLPQWSTQGWPGMLKPLQYPIQIFLYYCMAWKIEHPLFNASYLVIMHLLQFISEPNEKSRLRQCTACRYNATRGESMYVIILSITDQQFSKSNIANISL